MQKRKIDLVLRVLWILLTSALFWSIVTHPKVKCSPPTTPRHRTSLTPASRSRLPRGFDSASVTLSNDGSSSKCWTLKNRKTKTKKKHQNHRVAAACCLCFMFIFGFGNRYDLFVCVFVESRWLRHLINTA